MFRRIRLARALDLCGGKGRLLLGKSVNFHLGKNSKVIIESGTVSLGFPLPGTAQYASRPESHIHLEDGARIVFKGNAAIAPGLTIRVRAGGCLTLGGNNLIGHDSILLCSREMQIGLGSSMSWNVTLIDDDGHRFLNPKGAEIRHIYRPMSIGAHVGLQMNVVVPSGVSIGDGAIVSANTVLRQNVPANALVYSETHLKVKHGYRTQFSANENL